MKKLLVVLVILSFTSFTKISENVYICGPKGSSKYHYTENCRGLNACKHEVVKKSLKEAKDLGLTLCGWED
ncbi:hypothetical protein [Flavobacterium sp.]|uniref:hypothetical protein n=1 Tax=Flavobacterium sp. TaxID=239 RepID=UPI002B4B3DD3|nr:hypothetical protein [Flavobacterium sp.]HLP65488.1 hypothetical protein [Flavobacterium sp.]